MQLCILECNSLSKCCIRVHIPNNTPSYRMCIDTLVERGWVYLSGIEHNWLLRVCTASRINL